MNPEILKEASKEHFRRKLLILSRIIAIGLIIAIVWIGFIQIKYAKEINRLKKEWEKIGSVVEDFPKVNHWFSKNGYYDENFSAMQTLGFDEKILGFLSEKE